MSKSSPKPLRFLAAYRMATAEVRAKTVPMNLPEQTFEWLQEAARRGAHRLPSGIVNDAIQLGTLCTLASQCNVPMYGVKRRQSGVIECSMPVPREIPLLLPEGTIDIDAELSRVATACGEFSGHQESQLTWHGIKVMGALATRGADGIRAVATWRSEPGSEGPSAYAQFIPDTKIDKLPPLPALMQA